VRYLLLLSWAGLALLLAGCGGGTGASATPTPTPTPAEIIDQAIVATRDAESLAFMMDFAGAPVYADPNSRLFRVLDVEGQLQRPAAARSTIRVRSVGSVAEIRLVSFEGQLYVTNPVTQQWQCFNRGDVLDPVTLFDPDEGLYSLIRDQFTDVELLGSEELADTGRQHYLLQGTIAGAPLREISFGLLGAGTVDVRVWVDQETMRVSQVVLEDTATDPDDPSIWTISFSDYNTEVDIRAPTTCP
jgi:hypothetical protein